MRILHVLPAYHPAVRYGGPVFVVQGLARALAARGHDVTVMTTNVDGARISDVPLDRPVRRDGVSIRYFASPALRRVFWAPALGQALRDTMTSFDVVHIHQLYQWPAWMAARVARARGVPYVLSPRGMLVKEMIRRRSAAAKTLWINLFDKPSLQGAAAIHATSGLEQAEIEAFAFTLPPIATVPNGVDAPLPLPAGEDVAADVRAAVAEQPVVLYLGRLSWKKGLDRLIRAFADTLNGSLVIAGPDDEGLGPHLTALARELGVAQRVRILPRSIHGADKEFLFAAAHMFVLPSYSENFGNTVLEAMRRGVPVITTPQVGAAAIVQRAGGGVVSGGEPEALSQAMARLMHHPSLARVMGAAGRRHATEHYGWPRIAERMEGLYASLKR